MYSAEVASYTWNEEDAMAWSSNSSRMLGSLRASSNADHQRTRLGVWLVLLTGVGPSFAGFALDGSRKVQSTDKTLIVPMSVRLALGPPLPTRKPPKALPVA